MNYNQTVEYLYNRLPMFHRIGKAAYKADLHNTIALCNHLDNPQEKFRSIHVAGTNGKGSSSHLLAAILQSAGYKTGLYTSPHLKSFTERIRINGKEISQEAVVDFVTRHQSFIEQVQPSFFELTVGLAFDEFARQKVDIAIIEVGLGGRLDSTNIIKPLLSLITNISYDHQDILGETLPEIAFEKAGIIKHKTPVVISEFQPEVADVFKAKAKSEQAPLFFATDSYKITSKKITGKFQLVDAWQQDTLYLSNLKCQLTGGYQLKNLPGVLKAVDLLNQQHFSISEQATREGIGQVNTITGLKGRWQKLNQSPLIICDTGHNEGGIKEVINHISKTSFDKLFIVLGFVKDKDLSHILPLFPKNAYYFFCQAQIPRALDAEVLQQQALKFGLHGEVVRPVNEAINRAKEKALETDMIFIGGSTFVVAEIEGL